MTAAPTGPATFDPGTHTVPEVQAYVDADPATAQTVLDAERAGRDRITLVAWLQTQLRAAA